MIRQRGSGKQNSDTVPTDGCERPQIRDEELHQTLEWEFKSIRDVMPPARAPDFERELVAAYRRAYAECVVSGLDHAASLELLENLLDVARKFVISGISYGFDDDFPPSFLPTASSLSSGPWLWALGATLVFGVALTGYRESDEVARQAPPAILHYLAEALSLSGRDPEEACACLRPYLDSLLAQAFSAFHIKRWDRFPGTPAKRYESPAKHIPFPAGKKV